MSLGSNGAYPRSRTLGLSHQAGLTALRRIIRDILSLNILSPCLHADTLPIIPDVQSRAYDRRDLVWVWVLGSGFAPNSLRPWSAPLRASAFPPAKGGWSRQSQTCLPGLPALISEMHPRTTGGAWLRHSQADAVSH